MTYIIDRAQETCDTYVHSTGVFTLTGATARHRTIGAALTDTAGSSNGLEVLVAVNYAAASDPNSWEIMTATYTDLGTTLTRVATKSSSNGSSAVDFEAGVSGDNLVIYGVISEKYVQQRRGTGCSVYLSGNQTLSSGVIEIVEFDTESWDFGNDFNTGTYKYTTPHAGYYDVVADIVYDIAADADRIVTFIYVDAANVYNRFNESGGTYFVSVSINKTIYCTAGQTIDIRAQNLDAADTINSGVKSSFFQVHPKL